MKHRVSLLLMLPLLAACGDEGGDVPAVCGDYCVDVCAQLVSCQLTTDEAECRASCEGWAAADRVPERSCEALAPLAEMGCGPLSGYTQRWFTDGWDQFPSYNGSGQGVSETCFGGGVPGVFTYTLELSLYRGALNFYLFSEIVGEWDMSFQDTCELAADGSCSWTFPYDFRLTGGCDVRKTDHIDFTPDGQTHTGMISINYSHDSGDCDSLFAQLPCDIVWSIQGTTTAP